MPMPLKPVDRDKTIQLYTAGLTYQEIARQVGISAGLVWRRLHDWGIIGTVQRHGGNWRRDIDSAAIVAQYVSGTSEKALSDQFGIDRNGIRARLTGAGIVARGRSEAERLKWSILKTDRAAVERQCRNAWTASTGRIASLSTLRIAARTRAQRLTHVGRYEDALRIALRKFNIKTVPQYAVGPYNLDLALRPDRIAVEIITAYLDTAKSVAPKRIHYLFDKGWSVLILWCPARQAVEPDTLAQHVIAFAERIRSNPPARRQYGVIWSDGQSVASTRFQAYDGARVLGF